MSTSHPILKRRAARLGTWSVVVILSIMLWLAGCDTPEVPPPSPTNTPAPTGVAQVEPPASNTVVAPNSGTLGLTWWTPEFLSPSDAQPSGSILAQQIEAFETSQDGRVEISPVLKARYGKGGLLDLMRTAQPVAPTILPDLVALDVTELEQAASLGLLQPLEELLDAETVARLYPFARRAGQFEGHLLAVQYAADLEHAVYASGQIESPPQTWFEWLDDPLPYLMPLGGRQTTLAGAPAETVQLNFISQYLAAGGSMDGETRQLIVNEEPLLRVLSFYEEALQSGALPPTALQTTNLDETWEAYVDGDVAMANVSARRYLVERESLTGTSYTSMPGWRGATTPLAAGWALAITTADPERQRVAADFITWLLDPERAGAWARGAGWLPTQPQAWASWSASPYRDYLDGQLASAFALPAGPNASQVSTELQKALVSVLQNQGTPSDAADAALAALQLPQ